MDTAWMIRNDGKAFGIGQHVYGTLEIQFVEETLAAAEWLYKHTNHDSTKELVLEFISVWVKTLSDVDGQEEVVDYIQSMPFKFLSVKFVRDIWKALPKQVEKTLNNLNNLINMELNQEFMRVRFGGMYNTNAGSKEMVFRISSAEFDWYNIIYMFVADHKSMIQTVTIVKDEESTGVVDYYYKSRSQGVPYNNMPVEDFLEESKASVVEKTLLQGEDFTAQSYVEIHSILETGKPVAALFDLHMNREIIFQRYKMLQACYND